jgi:hypothetical protein
LDIGTTVGRCGTGGGLASLKALIAARLDDEPLSLTDEEGVEVPLVEFRVEDDLAVGTVPFDSLEESDVRKLALERLRSSLKNGIAVVCGLGVLHSGSGHDVGSPDAGTRFRSGRARVR